MDVNSVSGVSAGNYSVYETDTKKTAAQESTAAEKKTNEGVVYEKSSGTESTEKKATYSINKMSSEDRAALVQQLKNDQEARKQSFIDMVSQMFKGQGKTFAFANGDGEDAVWKMLAGGDFTVDAATKAQAQKDISEDGYWGITQTSQRLFDFASALAGDDEDKMKEMQAAMEKGFKQATGVWGRDLPQISSDTLSAANKLFEDYYKSKEETTV